MKRRTRQNVEYWLNRMEKLFNLDPKFKSTKKRYDALYRLLQKRYPFLRELEYEQAIQFLKDTVYLDRELRRMTQGKEQELKQELSQEWQLDNGYSPNYQQDINFLKNL